MGASEVGTVVIAGEGANGPDPRRAVVDIVWTSFGILCAAGMESHSRT